MNTKSDAAQENTGHGHVYPRPDGIRARCGGPGICAECSREAARKASGETTITPTPVTVERLTNESVRTLRLVHKLTGDPLVIGVCDELLAARETIAKMKVHDHQRRTQIMALQATVSELQHGSQERSPAVDKCPTCEGSGQLWLQNCPQCKGNGDVPAVDTAGLVALIEELRNDFINIVVGGCTCGTKPPDPALHELNCHYRMAETGLARIEKHRAALTPSPTVDTAGLDEGRAWLIAFPNRNGVPLYFCGGPGHHFSSIVNDAIRFSRKVDAEAALESLHHFWQRTDGEGAREFCRAILGRDNYRVEEHEWSDPIAALTSLTTPVTQPITEQGKDAWLPQSSALGNWWTNTSCRHPHVIPEGALTCRWPCGCSWAAPSSCTGEGKT